RHTIFSRDWSSDVCSSDLQTRNGFTRLKALPAKASLKWVRLWEKHLERLEKIMDPQPFLAGLPSTKVEQFASQAYQMEISDITRSEERRVGKGYYSRVLP